MTTFKDISLTTTDTSLSIGSKVTLSYIPTTSLPNATTEVEKMQLLMMIVSRLANESNDPVVKEAAAKLFSGAIAH